MKIGLNLYHNKKLVQSNDNKESAKHNRNVSSADFGAKNMPVSAFSTENIIAFKGLFSFWKTEKDENFLPEQKLTKKQAIGLINKNFKSSEVLKELEITPDEVIQELENLKYPINPIMLDSAAKVLELAANMRASSLADEYDLRNYLPLFYDENEVGVFHKEVLDKLYEVGTRLDETGQLYFAGIKEDKNVFKYISQIKDNNGNFHPKALNELRFVSKIKYCSKHGNFNEEVCDFVEVLANHEKNKKLSFSTKYNSRSLLNNIVDYNLKTDKEALKFAYELLEDKNFSLAENDAGHFINASKNIKNTGSIFPTFNPEYKKYYFLLTELCNCDFTKELPVRYNLSKRNYLAENELKSMCNVIKAIHDSYGKDAVKNMGFTFLQDLSKHAIFEVPEDSLKLINLAKKRKESRSDIVLRILLACRNTDYTFNKLVLDKAIDFIQKPGATDNNIIFLLQSLNLGNNNINKNMADIIDKSNSKYDLHEIATVFTLKKYMQDNVQEVFQIYDEFKNKYYNKFQETQSDSNECFIDIFSEICRSCLDENNSLLNKDKFKKAEYYADKIDLSLVPFAIKTFGFDNFEKFDLYKKVWDCAKQNKQILRQPGKTLSDKDINEFFMINSSILAEGLELVGEKIFINSFNLKINNLLQFYKLLNYNLYGNSELIKRYINPKESHEYKFWEERLSTEKENLKNSLSFEEKARESLLLNKIQKLNDEIKVLKLKELPKEKPILKSKQKGVNFLKSKIQMIYNKPENQEIIKKINIAQQWINSIESKAIKDPNTAIRVLKTIPGLCLTLSYSELEEYLTLAAKDDVESKEQLKLLLNKKIFNHFGIENDTKLSKKLDMTSSKYYLSLLGTTREDFKNNFKSLLTVLSENPDKSVSEILNDLEQNEMTKYLFEMKGINYDRWVNADKNSFISVVINTDKELEQQSVIRNIERDFSDSLFSVLPQEERQKLFSALKDNGFVVNLDFQSVRFFKNSKYIKFEDAGLLLKTLKEFFNKDEFWNTTNADSEVENAKNTILDHILKQRIPEYNNAKSTNSLTDWNLKVRQTDMNNISHAMFLGNQAGCCTAVGGVNDWSAPNYIKNKCVSAIEVVDGEDSLGNTMCFIADVDNETSLVLDNIELVSQIQFNENVKNGIIEYAKKLCEELGKPDMPIYAGPFRHKVHLEDYPFSSHNIKIIGSTGDDLIYADFTSRGINPATSGVRTTHLYKLK